MDSYIHIPLVMLATGFVFFFSFFVCHLLVSGSLSILLCKLEAPRFAELQKRIKRTAATKSRNSEQAKNTINLKAKNTESQNLINHFV